MITLNSSVYIVLPIIQILDYTVNYLIHKCIRSKTLYMTMAARIGFKPKHI